MGMAGSSGITYRQSAAIEVRFRARLPRAVGSCVPLKFVLKIDAVSDLRLLVMFVQVAPATVESAMWKTPREVTAYASWLVLVGFGAITWTAPVPTSPAEMSVNVPPPVWVT